MVDALRSRIVGEASLARAIEAQYCSAGSSGQASGKAVSEHLLQQVQKQQGEIEHLQQQLERLKPRDTGATSTGAGRINHPKSYQQHATEVARQEQLQQPLQLLQGGAHSTSKYPKPRISLHWEKLPDAPQEVEGGTAVSQGKMAYFNGYNSTMVYAYNSELRKWSRLPDCPQICFSLVVTVGMLTAVGGVLGEYPGGEPTSILRSLDGRSGTWMKHFPAMPTERQSLVAVCSGQSLIAAGGYQSGICLTTVEVLDVVSLQWFTASSLPQLFWGGTATICGDRLYLLGGHEYSVEVTLSVLFCSLPELLQSCKPQSSEETTVWYRAADTKYYKSAGTTLCGQLLAIGGHVKPRGDTDAIQIYDPTSNSWGAVAGMMPTVRHCSGSRPTW